MRTEVLEAKRMIANLKEFMSKEGATEEEIERKKVEVEQIDRDLMEKVVKRFKLRG